jgi:protein-L-isoaspartate(D-aspartate) O-methyltransferase
MALLDHRTFFAELITANVGVTARDGTLVAAFSATPRERFVGPGPWKVFTPVGYIQTPSDDPALIYQDITIALSAADSINNGQPTLHALSLAALDVKAGETVIHIGAGTGYYTAVLSRLVKSSGVVFAYELQDALASKAVDNLADLQNIRVSHRSGSVGPLPDCDVIYVNAGATDPMDVWLDALRIGGRLLFPLTPKKGLGGMLLVTRRGTDCFDARFVSRAMFIPCIGARDDETAQNLSAAFERDDLWQVLSLRRNATSDTSCWVSGRGWWLSKSPNPQ